MRCFILIAVLAASFTSHARIESDLTHAVVVLEKHALDPVGQNAARVLIEEVERRTGIRWEIGDAEEHRPRHGIQIKNEESRHQSARPVVRLTAHGPEPAAPTVLKSEEENFTVGCCTGDALWIEASTPHALLFGIGHFLQNAVWSEGSISFVANKDALVGTPHYPLRGHQLGYRARANSYDAWDDKQMEQYIRELTFFGTNAIENIPFQDDQHSPHMKLSRRDMNRRMSEICAQYGLQYWVWTPAEFHLDDEGKRAAHLAEHAQLYADCPRIDGVFFPGGDPGENPPQLVLPFLEELSKLLQEKHPQGKIWLSLQWFNDAQMETIYKWIDDEQPAWLGGLVGGPSTPPLKAIRHRLHKNYPLRDYPDITHTTRCQYPVPWWDPAFALTLGRECINPRPQFYADVVRELLPVTNGFISYSDGCHDNVNAVVWSMLGMNPEMKLEEVLRGYANLFFGAKHAEEIARGIASLEKNWEGAVAANEQIEKTLTSFQKLEKQEPALAETWRGQMLLVRAEYDAYVKRREDAERGHELSWNETMKFHWLGTDEVAETVRDNLFESLAALNATLYYPGSEIRDSIESRFDTLFRQIGLQTSVPKHSASAPERGCSLDFIDYPLNNRWWIEDELKKLQDKPVEEQRARILEIVNWENPGPGGFYDALGHPGRSPHVDRSTEANTYPDLEHSVLPTQWWWDNGMSRQRLTWQTSMDWPTGLDYEELDPEAQYTLRCTGYGEALPKADDTELKPTRYGKEIGEVREFPIPQEHTVDGKLRITWTRPGGEEHLNWRQQSRVSEVWLVRGNDDR